MANLSKTFSETLREIFDLRGLNAKKISEITDISEVYVAALLNNDTKKLPALPYARGYILKIAEVANIDPKDLIELYKKEIPEYIGEKDKLPFNRFSRKLIDKKKLIFQIIIMAALIYLIFRIDDLVGVPKIEIINPAENYLIVSEPFINISGVAQNFFDKLTINGEEIPINKNGLFEKKLELHPGENNIEFKIKRFLGRELKVVRKVIYQP
ncbi:helix-turn-helix domain-containing protein [Candidatus Wolfebacteria bacterium]|nr:helix-turn-helix domain-containing protein [Candidatus Wolfebacteria bacterium]